MPQHTGGLLSNETSALEQRIHNNTQAGKPTCIPHRDRPASVSAAFLTELLRSRTYGERGLVLIGAQITGQFDCSDLEITAPLRLLSCSFDRPPILARAHLRLLDLRRSTMPGLVIDGAIVTHDLLLRRAKIKPTNGSGTALSAYKLIVSQEADFRHLVAQGGVRLLGATIGGQFNCADATLTNANGYALSMDRAEVKGGVFLRAGFTAKGGVRLPGATIGGQFNCNGAKLTNEKGYALTMDGAEVKRDVVFALRYVSNGEPSVYRLRNAHFGHLNLALSDGSNCDTSQLDTILLLEGTTYDSLDTKENSGSQTSGTSSWCHKWAAKIKGTSELEQFPGNLYRSILIDQQKAPAPDGGIYPATYTTTSRALRDVGSEQLTKELLVQKNRQLNRARPALARPFSWLLDITVGYGYRPRLSLLWALVVYVVAAMLFIVAVHHHGIVATPLAGTSFVPNPLKGTSRYPTFSAWNYAFGALLSPFVHLPGVDAWRANATTGWGLVVRITRWVEPVVLWTLVLTLGATLTGLVTRDRP